MVQKTIFNGLHHLNWMAEFDAAVETAEREERERNQIIFR